MRAAVTTSSDILTAVDKIELLTNVAHLEQDPVVQPILTFVVTDLLACRAALIAADARRVGADLYELNGFHIDLVTSPDVARVDQQEELIHTSPGKRQFCGLEIEMTEGVFWPHPASEELVADVLAHTNAQTRTVIDVGTGSGAIALAIAQALPHARVIGTDTSPAAVTCAAANAGRLGLANAHFVESDLVDGLEQLAPVDLIVANLPWLSPVDVALRTLDFMTWSGPMPTVRGAGRDGLGLLRRLAQQAVTLLDRDGLMFLSAADWQIEHLASELEADYDCTIEGKGGLLLCRVKTSAD